MEKARKEVSITHVHNEKLIDEYAWLRDKNWPVVNSTEIIDYLNNENKKAENYFNKYKGLEDVIFREIKNKIIENDKSYPIKIGEYNYFQKYEKNKEYPIYYRNKENKETKDELLLDINNLDMKGCNHQDFKISPNHKLFAYSVDYRGSEIYKIITQNVSEPETKYEEINGVDGSIIWDYKGDGYFYIKLTDNLRSSRVYYHKLKTEQKEDQLLYEENDEVFELEIIKTSDGKYLLVIANSKSENEVRYIDLINNELYEEKKLFEREEGKIFIIDHKKDYFYIKSNDKGKNFRLSKVGDDDLYNMKKWEEIIPHNKKEYIVDFYLSYKYVVVNKKIQGITKIFVYNENEEVKTIQLQEDLYSATGFLPTYQSELIRVSYSSLITPLSILEYDFEEEKIYERQIQKLPFEYNKKEYEYKRIYAKATDEELIPISIVYKNDKFLNDGTNPLYLLGYGAYGISISPKFNTKIFTLVDRGVVFAIAHIRGGDDMGYEWYEKAKFLTKKLTFTDFISCAEELIEEKYTNSKSLIIAGGSAGGMAIGYAINEKPELFKAAILHMPFLDVLNTMLDETLPLTVGEYNKWGDPKNKEYFDYIKSYSPYENIKEQIYPSIYVLAGLNDPLVRYWEPAKWVAKINNYKKGDNSVILYTDMESGHQGQTGRYEILKEKSQEYAFVFIELGLVVCEDKKIYNVEIKDHVFGDGMCLNFDNIDGNKYLEGNYLYKIEEIVWNECSI